MSTKFTKPMTVIPSGTVASSPDPIHRVTLMFPTADDAVVFFEWLLSVSESVEVSPGVVRIEEQRWKVEL